MTKTYMVSPKPKYGHPKRVIKAFNNGQLVSMEHYGETYLPLQEAILTNKGYSKVEWVEPQAIQADAEDEDEGE